jgi:simple sugar transport system ATP-binding protein
MSEHRRVDAPIAEVSGVSKRFGATVALEDVHLAVAPGEVHALVGRNGAGKSTLVSILTGLAAPDAGTVRLSGEPAPPISDRQAWRRLVACVYQKLTIIPALSVAENLFLNRQAASRRPIGWIGVRRQARALLDAWGLDVDPRVPAGELNVEQRQLLEIARALSFGARFIILDEPTARLDAGGIARLFRRIRALQRQGVTFLFISHHLQEIFELCERVTVLRDARRIITAPVGEISHSALVEAMTGEPVSDASDPRPPQPTAAAPMLSVHGLAVGSQCRDVSFDVAAGEVVGLAGAGASGKFAVADAIAGLVRPDAGTIHVAGRPLRPGSVPRVLSAGVGVVPRDRHREGFVGGLSVAENATMTVPRRLGRHGFVSPRRRTALSRELINVLDIVPPRPDLAVADLSGGNQQKVVMARALVDRPRVLVLMAPTLGVDVKSKQAVMDQAAAAARNGAAVLLVTDDLDDLRYCHRILVMFRGDMVAGMAGTWVDRDVVAAMEGVEISRD